MNDVQNIVTGQVKGVQVVRLRFYADEDLKMTAVLKEVFQYAFTQGEFEMKDGQGWILRGRDFVTKWDGVP